MVRSCCAYNCTVRGGKESRRWNQVLSDTAKPIEEEAMAQRNYAKNFPSKDHSYRICSQNFVRGKLPVLLLLCPSGRDFRLRVAIGPTFYLLYVGEKSDDPLSPAYVPTIFSFTPSAEKQVAEQSVKRYESRKRRERRNKWYRLGSRGSS